MQSDMEKILMRRDNDIKSVAGVSKFQIIKMTRSRHEMFNEIPFTAKLQFVKE